MRDDPKCNSVMTETLMARGTGNDQYSGLDNLLVESMGVTSGHRVLLVLEPPSEQLYDPVVGKFIARRIQQLGAQSTTMMPELFVDPKDFPGEVADAMQTADHTLFLSRVGDYARFLPQPGPGTKTICYARDTEMLNAPFASLPNELMVKLQHKLEAELMDASHWRITCPNGTDIKGSFCWPSLDGGTDDEFTQTLFPATTFKPVPCNTANGTIAISRWLMAGAGAKVDPAVMDFTDVVKLHISNGMLDRVTGPEESARRVENYYDLVSNTLNISRNRIHSWHTGINPQTWFDGEADDNLERWGAISFASPRYLHFHTCGDIPPGEVALSVFYPTVYIDDELYWQRGEYVWLHRPDNVDMIDQVDGASILLEPSLNIGI